MATSLDDLACGVHVLVTGATGYVAGGLVERLLKAGSIVHAAVRDPSDTAKVAHLRAMAKGSAGSVVFFKTNLLEAGSYDEAMRGCEVVFHTASPFLPMPKVGDPQRDLVDPALKGTRNVLDTANRTAAVKRLVLTSSGAAISGGPADLAKAPGGILTEACWNTVSSLDNGPYPYSKTVAERAAWEIAKAQDRWRLVVINPGFVLGPATSRTHTSASFSHLQNLGEGTFPPSLLTWRVGMVDVLDVAEAHFRGGFTPQAEGRHIVWAGEYSFGDLAQMLEDAFGDRWPFPKNTSPPDGQPLYRADNTKSKLALGMQYHPVKDAAVAMFQQLIDTGQLSPP